MPINFIYGLLVTGPDDFIGALAYSLYKQTKVEWVTQYKAANGGADPSLQAYADFHVVQLLPTSLASYKERATTLAGKFLDLGLQERLDEITAQTMTSAMNSALASKFDLTHSVAAAELVSLRRATDTLHKSVEAEKGLKGWVSDVAAGFLVNMISLVIVGFVFWGVAHIERFNRFFDTSPATGQGNPPSSPGLPRLPPPAPTPG